jgi:hypothetical protein
VSVFRQSESAHLERRSCRYCPALADAASDTCSAHGGEAGRLVADPRRAGYRSSAYRLARRSALRRAKGRCEACGARLPRRDGRLLCQTHHRDGDPTHNRADGSNLLVCCLACHSGRRSPS